MMWVQTINASLGIWLLAAPGVLGYADPALTSDRIVGPLAVLFSVVAASGATRAVRWLNLPLGLWLCLAPWVLGYAQRASIGNSLGVGLCLILLAPVRGRIRQQFGGGWSSLFQTTHHPGNGP